MEKISFKKLIIVNIIFLYIVFSLVIFSVFNNLYFSYLKKEFINQNNYAAKVAKDLIEEEKASLVVEARIIASDDLMYYAFSQQKYIENRAVFVGDYLQLKVSPVDKIKYNNIANLMRNKIYGSGRGSEEKGLELIDGQFKLVAYSQYFDKDFLDREISKEKSKYIIDTIGADNLGGVEVSLIQENKDKFFIKGTAPVGKNTRHLYVNPYGVVVVGEKLDGNFLERIKKMVNRELLITKGDKIITSTIFQDVIRVENEIIDSKGIKKNDQFTYCESFIKNKKVGITYFSILDYDNKEIANIGVGFYYSNLEVVYKESTKKFFVYELIFSIVLFILFYTLLNRLFKPFDRILKRIGELKEGKYEKRIDIKRERPEFQILIDSINNLSDTIKDREEELRKLNIKLEEKVKERTKEVNEKNKALEELVLKIGKVNRKMTEEIETARKIHEKVIDFVLPKMENYNLQVENISISGIGGDFVETIKFDNKKVGIFFADVSGHGVGAALMISALKLIINLYFKQITKPSEALYLLNDIVNEYFVDGITISAHYLIIDEEREEIVISSAAQEDIVFMHKENVEKIGNKNIILGVLGVEEIENDERLSYKDTVIKLESGEKLFLYTDGLVEQKVLSRDGVMKILIKYKDKKAKEIMEVFNREVKPHLITNEKDDVTYMFVEKK